MSQRFDYVRYDEAAQQLQSEFKAGVELLANAVDRQLPKGRYAALAMTALEEFYAWVGKAIRDDQTGRIGPSPDRPERGE